MPSYDAIDVGGLDTAAPLNLTKRLDIVDSRIGLAGRRVLDCGCGAGEYVVEMCARGAKAQGVEYSAEKVAEFQRRYPDDTRVQQGDLQSLSFEDSSFDLAIFNEVLEHVPDDGSALREAFRVLGPGGALVVLSPNRFYPFESHGARLRFGQLPLKPYLPFVPYIPVRLGRLAIEYSARNYWPWELRSLVRDAGFHIEETGYVWQTFEGLSGSGRKWMAHVRPTLRAVAGLGERLPIVRCIGVSQLVVARRPR